MLGCLSIKANSLAPDERSVIFFTFEDLRFATVRAIGLYILLAVIVCPPCNSVQLPRR